MPKSTEVVTTPELECLRETEKAFLFRDPTKPKATFWVPKSQIQDPAPDEIGQGTIQEITIPKWLADEKDLV